MSEGQMAAGGEYMSEGHMAAGGTTVIFRLVLLLRTICIFVKELYFCAHLAKIVMETFPVEI